MMLTKLIKIDNDLPKAETIYTFEREDGKTATLRIKTTKIIGKTLSHLSIGMYVKGLRQLPDGTLNPESDIIVVAHGMERIAEVTRVDPPKKSRNGDTSYIRVCFRLWGYTDEFAKTDVCGTFRNRPKWDEIIKKGVGTKITGWSLMPNKIPQTINADSNIKIL